MLIVAVIFSPIEPWFLAPLTCLGIRNGWLDQVGRFAGVFPFFEWLFYGMIVDLLRRCRGTSGARSGASDHVVPQIPPTR